MIMENMDKVLNTLIAKLLRDGSASFSQDGLNIETTYNDGCLNIAASFTSPEIDEAQNLRDSFKEYVSSLSDDFFLEVAETFEEGVLKKIQDKLDSKNIKLVREGVKEFMLRLKEVAASKISAINSDISDAKKEIEELIEIRDSYVHVLNKKF